MRTLHEKRIPSRVVDILEVEGGWMSMREIAAQIEDRFEEVNLFSVKRAVYRLRANGFIITRPVGPERMTIMSGSPEIEVRFA